MYDTLFSRGIILNVSKNYTSDISQSMHMNGVTQLLWYTSISTLKDIENSHPL